MSEIVKRDRKKQIVPSVGARVSVKKEYFDVDKKSAYSATLPPHITKLVGSVIFVYEESKKVRIEWDVDKTKIDVKVDDIQIEPIDEPIQSLDLQESFVEEDEQSEPKVCTMYFMYYISPNFLFLNNLDLNLFDKFGI